MTDPTKTLRFAPRFREGPRSHPAKTVRIAPRFRGGQR